MPRHDSYTYSDGRDFLMTDGRRRPGYMTLWRTELAHMVGADLRKAAILLYLYIGTHVSGTQGGFRIGKTELLARLNMNRSTLYKALRELRDAGLIIEPDDGDGLTTRLQLATPPGSEWATGQQVAAIRAARRAARPEGVDNPSESVSHGRLDCSPMGDHTREPLHGSSREPDSSRACGDVDKSASASTEPHSDSPPLRPPAELVAAVWARLQRHSHSSPGAPFSDVFEAAADADPLLLALLIESDLSVRTGRPSALGRLIGSSCPTWSTSTREDTMRLALIEAGNWGPNGQPDL